MKRSTKPVHAEMRATSERIRAVHMTGIGASEAGIIMGASRYKDPLGLWAEKRGLEDVEEQEMDGPMYWGHRLEAVVLQECAIRTGHYVMHAGGTAYGPDGEVVSVPRIKAFDLAAKLLGPEPVRHTEHDWMLCHPDGVAISDDLEIAAVIEGKTVGFWMQSRFGEEDTDEVPEIYRWQAIHAMEVVRSVLGREVPVIMPVLKAGQTFGIYRIGPDPKRTADLLEAEATFWHSVQEGEMPPAAPDMRGAASLARVFPEHEGEELVDVSHDEEASGALEWLGEAEGAYRHAEGLRVAAQNAVKELIADRPGIEVPGLYRATWKKSADMRVTDWAAVYADVAPLVPAKHEQAVREAIARHTTERQGSRRFLFRSLDKS